MTSSSRYARQSCLAEVGKTGQLALKEASVVVTASGFSGVIEREYLIRAGVGEVTLSSSGSEPFEHEARFHFDCSREIAAGAWRALRKIRLALDGG